MAGINPAACITSPSGHARHAADRCQPRTAPVVREAHGHQRWVARSKVVGAGRFTGTPALSQVP
ncbi:hypothetical protein, partial [Xanthomonas campestris]|uniref:hypothetical protein n=1 Tax=Xanthomonas campestris TaxID=339 RepID=UPI00403A77E9